MNTLVKMVSETGNKGNMEYKLYNEFVIKQSYCTICTIFHEKKIDFDLYLRRRKSTLSIISPP